MTGILDPAQPAAPGPENGSHHFMTSTTRRAARETVAASTRNPTTAYLVVLFMTYLVLLAWIVLWKLEVPWAGGGERAIKLVPFAPSAGAGASEPFEVVVNLVIFVPFGVYLGLLAPRAWWKGAGVVAAASLVLEATQYVLAIGRSDVTDVIVNVAGGLTGLGLVALARRWLRARTTSVMTRVCSIGTVVVLLASAIFVASPLRHAPRPHPPMVSTHSAPAGAWLQSVLARSEEPG